MEYALRNDDEKGGRVDSPRRKYGRRGDSPYSRRSPSPVTAGFDQVLTIGGIKAQCMIDASINHMTGAGVLNMRDKDDKAHAQ